MRMKAVQSVDHHAPDINSFSDRGQLFYKRSLCGKRSPPAPGDFSELRRTGMVNVKAIIDPQTIQLEDGHIVRLTGIDFPDFNPDEPGDFSLTAMQILRDMLVGKTVLLYQTVNREEGRINRMGQDIAQVQRESDKVWVQGTLLSLRPCPRAHGAEKSRNGPADVRSRAGGDERQSRDLGELFKSPAAGRSRSP
jgi:hypothetical protein